LAYWFSYVLLFDGLDPAQLPRQWLDADTSAPTDAASALGPESIIGPQALILQSTPSAGQARAAGYRRVRPFAACNRWHHERA